VSKEIKKIRKAVIPAAGFGTRFLPQTKAMPKEMLPLVDKPIIQYIVEKLVEAGIEDVIIVTGYHKRAIEDHFDSPSQELVLNLKNGKKEHLLDELLRISNLANFFYVRQKGPYGNGTPLLNVRDIIGNEPFIYTWGDDMILASPNEFEQLIGTYQKYECSVLSGIRARTDDDYSRWGFVSGIELEKGIMEVKDIIEKPGKEKAPSNLGSVSSFLFTPEVFDYLNQALKNLGEGQEFYYNDALKLMLKDQRKIVVKEIENGEYIDSGNKIEYLKTITKFGLRNRETKDEYLQFLKGIISKANQ
jgi:UTP--glucose-1-phosphate uridylyltransferase